MKPERDAYDETKNSWNKSVKKNWWMFGAWRKALDMSISELDQVMVISEVTKYVNFVFVPVDIVFMHTLKVIAYSDWENLAVLSSSIYSEWAWKYSSTMGSGTLRYTPSTSFETFPFKKNGNLSKLTSIGEKFYNSRKRLMQKLQLGLTKTYNLFHSKEIKYIDQNSLNIEESQFDKKYDKIAFQLRKYIESGKSFNYEEILEMIEELRYLVVDIDKALLDLYDWSDIELRHSFYEMEYLPEHDRTRFTIHPDARKEILSRLLKLNHKIYSAEINSSKSGYSLEKSDEKLKDNFNLRLF